MKKQKGLGRGLDAIFGTEKIDLKAAPMSKMLEIEIGKIIPNPTQPRTEFDEEALDELADSIRQLGIIQPITVRKHDDGRYVIISGERRWRAAQRADLKQLPVYIREVDDENLHAMALVENIQREDLNAIEIALGMQRLIEECNLTQDALSEKVGKKRSSVANYLRLLKLPAEIQFAIRAKKISMGHAKALLALEDNKAQLKFANLIIEQDLSVRQIEQKIQKLGQKKEKKGKEESPVMELPESHFKVIEIVGKYFNNNITAKRDTNGAGEITIRFNNDKEVEEFLQALENSNI